ncbi:hypothetical protein HWV62_31931 [Athelia sp. TMB]|nr:hypothetical protein HWV62_31931 [Athelia sp. TMB]
MEAWSRIHSDMRTLVANIVAGHDATLAAQVTRTQMAETQAKSYAAQIHNQHERIHELEGAHRELKTRLRQVEEELLAAQQERDVGRGELVGQWERNQELHRQLAAAQAGSSTAGEGEREQTVEVERLRGQVRDLVVALKVKRMAAPDDDGGRERRLAETMKTVLTSSEFQRNVAAILNSTHDQTLQSQAEVEGATLEPPVPSGDNVAPISPISLRHLSHTHSSTEHPTSREGSAPTLVHDYPGSDGEIRIREDERRFMHQGRPEKRSHAVAEHGFAGHDHGERARKRSKVQDSARFPADDHVRVKDEEVEVSFSRMGAGRNPLARPPPSKVKTEPRDHPMEALEGPREELLAEPLIQDRLVQEPDDSGDHIRVDRAEAPQIPARHSAPPAVAMSPQAATAPSPLVLQDTHTAPDPTDGTRVLEQQRTEERRPSPQVTRAPSVVGPHMAITLEALGQYADSDEEEGEIVPKATTLPAAITAPLMELNEGAPAPMASSSSSVSMELDSEPPEREENEVPVNKGSTAYARTEVQPRMTTPSPAAHMPTVTRPDPPCLAEEPIPHSSTDNKILSTKSPSTLASSTSPPATTFRGDKNLGAPAAPSNAARFTNASQPSNTSMVSQTLPEARAPSDSRYSPHYRTQGSTYHPPPPSRSNRPVEVPQGWARTRYTNADPQTCWPPIPSFPIPATKPAKLLAHCQNTHAVACEKLSKMTENELQEWKEKLVNGMSRNVRAEFTNMSGSRYSKEIPGIQRAQRSTICKRPEDVPKEYDHRKQEGEIHYVEFSGSKAPDDDVGEPGDVWIDTTPGSYALWTMDAASKWVQWHGLNDKERPGNGGNPTWSFQSPHPYLEDRFIWVRHRGVVWLNHKDIVKEISIRKLTSQTFPIAAHVFLYPYLEQSGQVASNKRRATNEADEDIASKRARFEQGEPVILRPATFGPNQSNDSASMISRASSSSSLGAPDAWPASLSIPERVQKATDVDGAAPTSPVAPESVETPGKTTNAQALPPVCSLRSQKSPISAHVSPPALEPPGNCLSTSNTDSQEQSPGTYQTLLRKHNNQLQQDVKTLRTENAEFSKAKASLEAEVISLKGAITSAQNKHSLVAKQYESATKQIEILKGRQELMIAQHRSTEQQMRDLQAQIISNDDKTRLEVNARKATCAQLINEMDGVLSRADKAAEENIALQATIEELRKAQALAVVSKPERGQEGMELTLNNAPTILGALKAWAELESQKSAVVAAELENTKKELEEVRRARDTAMSLAKERETELDSLQSVQPLLQQVISKFRRGNP